MAAAALSTDLPMRTITTIERLIRRAGFGAALILLPLLMLGRLVEIVSRKLNMPGSLFNAMESELFLLFAFLIIGAAAVNGAHVRVDILRERFGPRARAWIELIGTVLFVLPFTCIVIWYGATMVGTTFAAAERSAIALGAPTRWIIVAATPVGIGLFALAVACRTARQILYLTGRTGTPE